MFSFRKRSRIAHRQSANVSSVARPRSLLFHDRQNKELPVGRSRQRRHSNRWLYPLLFVHFASAGNYIWETKNINTEKIIWIVQFLFKVVLLLLICYWLVHLAWRKNKDPDNVCIPYLTAIGDFLGTAFLAFCFHVLWLSGETRLRSWDYNDSTNRHDTTNNGVLFS